MHLLGLSIAADLLACGPQISEPSRDCDEAFEYVRRPTAPEEKRSIRPVEVGSELPVILVPQSPESAEDLANRTLAVACLFDPGVSAGNELRDWATSVSEQGSLPSSLLLGPRIEAEYEVRFGRLRLGIVAEQRAPPPDGVDDAITWITAESIARGVLADLRARGLTSDAPHDLMFVTHGGPEGYCADETPECRAEVQSHRFSFAPTYAGIPIPAAPIDVIIGSTGDLQFLALRPVGFEDAGTVTAELSEGDCRERLPELAAQKYPGTELHWEEAGRLEYWLPFEEPYAEIEPVWYGSFIPAGARPIEASVLLSDADADLVE